MTGKTKLPVGWPSELNFLSGFPCAAALREIFVVRFINVPRTDRTNNILVGYRSQEKKVELTRKCFFPVRDPLRKIFGNRQVK
jgi:hypothetical protein